MRLLLSFPFVVAATALICHGLFLESEAKAALATAKGPEALERVAAEHPYGRPAVSARRRLIEGWKTRPPERWPGGSGAIAMNRFERGIGEKAPWLAPETAAAIGVLGLLFAVFLPRQRGRSFALLFALFGAGLASPLLMDPGTQAEVVDAFDPYGTVLAEAGSVAAGLLLLAGFVLALARPRRRHDDD